MKYERVGKADGLHLQVIEESEVAGGLGGPLDGLAQGHSAGPAFGPVCAVNSVKGAGSFGYAAHQIQLGLRVGPGGERRRYQELAAGILTLNHVGLRSQICTSLRKQEDAHLKALTATTTGTPKCCAFSICFFRLLQPFSSSSRFCRDRRQHSGMNA